MGLRIGLGFRMDLIQKPRVVEVVDEILVKESAIGTLDEVGPTVIDLLIQAEDSE